MNLINDLTLIRQVTVIIVLLCISDFTVAEHHGFEVTVDMRASAVLPDDLRNGVHHRVANVVHSDGYLNYYTIQSDYGDFDAISTAMLKTRIGEINALAELEDLSKTDAGVGQLKTLKQFATNPVETVAGIPSGIGRMFNRYKLDASEAVDATQEFVAGSDDDKDEADKESTTDKAVGLTESFIGVSRAQLAWAQKLGTNPYSTNEVLQAAMMVVPAG